MKILNILFASILFITEMGFSQENMLPLWENGIPNHTTSDEVELREIDGILRIRKVQIPTLEIYLPSANNANGKGVIICPGGGYAALAYDWEGTDIAKWFNSKGIAAFVLKYRLPQSKSIKVQHLAPLQDAQRALRLVRYHSKKWNLNKNQIGIIGFSAGGHLASTLGTRFNEKLLVKEDDIDKISARPDFMILVYPVISMQKGITHEGSRENLLGNNPSKALVEQYSNELQVNKATPKTFIVHSIDDKAVPVENSLRFFQSLKDANVPSEIHIYPFGGHGFSLALGHSYLQKWTKRLEDWLKYIE